MLNGILHCVAVILVCFSSTVFGGGADGGGGDASHEVDKMWFPSELLGDVKYCVEVGRGFGVSESEADDAFQAAVQTWVKYAGERGVKMGQKVYTKLLSCDGSEDLTLYLGVSPKKVDDAKKAYIAPLAFAVREKFDLLKSWGKGFIWVAASGETIGDSDFAPSWKRAPLLRALLTHELGHVLGCTHLKGTIMDPSFSAQITGYGPGPWLGSKKITEIDQEKELLPKLIGTSSYSGAIATRYSRPSTQDHATFVRFTGHPPKGTVRSRLDITRFSGRLPEIKLALTDDIATTMVPVAWIDSGPVFEIGNGVFSSILHLVRIAKTERIEDGKSSLVDHEVHETVWHQETSLGMSATVRLSDAAGKGYDGTFAVNSAGAFPVSIEYQAPEGRIPLFSAH